MREEIIRKLRDELEEGITSERQVVYVLAEIRKLIEAEGLKKKYPDLNFHCDWSLHSALDRAGAKALLAQFDEAQPLFKAQRRTAMAQYLFDEPRFHDPELAREHLEGIRWPQGPVCPHCGACDRIGKLNGKAHRRGVYECGHCRDQFTVTVGTVFEHSKVSLDKWLFAATLMASSKKGASSKQIERMLGVTYKTAWFMTHRLREAIKPNAGGLLGSLGGTVEADETFIGRKPGTKVRHGHKEAVFALVERSGHVRSFHVNDVTGGTLRWKLAENVSYSATSMTDEARQYTEIGKDFADHTVEGFFSILKRGMYGVYQHCSSYHLHRYTTEFDFRYNHRQKLGFDDAMRTEELLKGIVGKRLTYRRTDAET